MALTFNIELASKPDRTGRYVVMVRLHQKEQKPARVVTSVKILHAPKYWWKNQKPPKGQKPTLVWGRWVKGHPASDAINGDILSEYERIKRQAEAWLKESAELTPFDLAERFRSGTSDLYFDWVDQVLADVQENESYNNWVNKRSAANLFKTFAGVDLSVNGVTLQLVRKFREHLRKTPKINRPDDEGKREASTINKTFDRLHSLHIEVLIKQGQTKKKAEFASPWNEDGKLKEKKPKKAKLNADQISDLAQVEVVSKRRVMPPENAFAIWMLSHLLAGARVSDMLTLRYKNFTKDRSGLPTHCKYEMLKTGTVVSFPVLEEARELLKRYWNPLAKPTDYVLPYLKTTEPYATVLTHEEYRSAPFAVRAKLSRAIQYWTRQIDTGLKLLEEEAGLTEKLRMHNSRHSFAEWARQVMQQDKTITTYDIQLLLGHTQFSTTEGYYKDGSEQDSTEAMQAIVKRKQK
ncbi:tyrosine-type recombinase/integrase [Spirosoma fluminis]